MVIPVNVIFKEKKKRGFYFLLFNRINARPTAAITAIASKPGVLGFGLSPVLSSLPVSSPPV
jgi:hypothetical protein